MKKSFSLLLFLSLPAMGAEPGSNEMPEWLQGLSAIERAKKMSDIRLRQRISALPEEMQERILVHLCQQDPNVPKELYLLLSDALEENNVELLDKYFPYSFCLTEPQFNHLVTVAMDNNKPDWVSRLFNIKAGGYWISEKALRWAAKNNYADVVTLLLEKRVDINAVDDAGHTALILAAENGNKDIVELLIKNGADPSAKHNEALLRAAERGHTEVIKLLLENGVAVDPASGNDFSALMRAAKFGHIDTVKFLLAAGAQVNAQNIMGITPLSEAAQEGHTQIVRLLLENGANPNGSGFVRGAVINSQPLNAAIMGGHLPIVRLLLAQNAFINIPDRRYGGTPITIAHNKKIQSPEDKEIKAILAFYEAWQPGQQNELQVTELADVYADSLTDERNDIISRYRTLGLLYGAGIERELVNQYLDAFKLSAPRL